MAPSLATGPVAGNYVFTAKEMMSDDADTSPA